MLLSHQANQLTGLTHLTLGILSASRTRTSDQATSLLGYPTNLLRVCVIYRVARDYYQTSGTIHTASYDSGKYLWGVYSRDRISSTDMNARQPAELLLS